MRYKLSWLSALLLIIFMMTLSGCSSMAKIAVTKPAEIDLLGINKIVIGTVRGNRGDQIQDAVTYNLIASDRYDVIDRETFDRVARQQSFNLGQEIDEAEARRMGHIIGTSVMVTGSAASNFNYKRGSKAYVDRNGIRHKKNSVDATLSLHTRLQLIELKSGALLGQKNIIKETQRSTSAIDQWAEVPSSDDLVRPLIKQTALEFLNAITDNISYAYVKFEDASTQDGRRGIELAEVGAWKEALLAFLQETKKVNAAKSWHNLGLAYQYSFQFDAAKEAFRKCISIELLEGCSQGLRNIDEMIKNENRLKKVL